MDTGKLIVSVTAVRGLYPIKGAEVSVYSGELKKENFIERASTDQSGRTVAFALKTKPLSMSLSPNAEKPYESYTVFVSKEGFSSEEVRSIPIFPGITSVQPINLTPLFAENTEGGTKVINEENNYDL